jgi:hypothetical protein
VKVEEKSRLLRLTARAAQALLFLWCGLQPEGLRPEGAVVPGEVTPGEFAAFRVDTLADQAGQTQRQLLTALLELESACLIEIIPQESPGAQALPATIPTSEVSNTTAFRDTVTPMQRCQRADASGDRGEQVRALQAVWDEVFPQGSYPYQRLTVDAARRWLAGGRGAAWLAGVMYRAVEYASGPIRYPRAYIERAIQSEIEHESRAGSGAAGVDVGVDVGVGVSSAWDMEAWKELARLGRRLYEVDGRGNLTGAS